MPVDTKNGHPAMDYNEHVRTYSGFLRATTISLVLVVLLLAWMAIFLTGH